MGRKKTPRYTEDESPNLRPNQAPRTDDEAEASMQAPPPTSSEANEAPTPAQQETASPPPANPLPAELILAELVKMMGVQQAAIQASNAQMQAFMTQQAQFQLAM
ncbi:unnamed protein product [Phytophthora lilii]|uniref:Unnamed protein product n=1 Tax=Phytophthora lilii TaxID=2077276 RepID=A0A9W6YKM2_9STRA|nr:unnamed protein product [Phytophthora lilii]